MTVDHATMRAVELARPGPPETLRLTRLPRAAPAQGELLVRVAYAALSPIDLLIRQGRAPWLRIAYPYVTGVEFSGIVEQVGAGVDDAWCGRPVVVRSAGGGHAEWASVRVEDASPLAPGVDLRQGAVYRSAALTAYLVLERAKAQPGQTCLIHSAAGAVGGMAVQIARAMGLTVVGLCSTRKTAAVGELGAHYAIAYDAPGWEQALADVPEAPAHLIVDGNGGALSARNLDLVRPGGTIVYLGAMAGTLPADVPIASLLMKGVGVVGFNLNLIDREEIIRADAVVTEGIAAGRWRMPIGRTFGLVDLPAAHRAFEDRQLVGRALVEVDPTLG